MIEKKISDTILQEKKVIEIGGVAYNVAPVSTATLIKVSKLIRELPVNNKEAVNPMYDVIAKAEGCEVLGDIAATLVLGAGKLQKRRLFSWLPIEFPVSKRRLIKDCLNLPPGKLNDIILHQLISMEVKDFFAITTSLTEINLIKRTKMEEVVN